MVAPTLFTLAEPRRRQSTGPAAPGRPAVFVVDGFFARPAAVRQHALGLRFAPDPGNYPGVRSPADRPADEIVARVERLLHRDLDRASVRLAFSMVTVRGAQLAPRQRMPHADGYDVAGVVYLNPPAQCRGGTAFYRHGASGLVALPAVATPVVAQVMRDHGLSTLGQLADWIMTPPAGGRRGFLTASTTDWELTALVRMRFNRLVLYDGRLFHSGHIGDRWFGATPARRRLTLNLFANFAIASQP